MAYRFDPTNPVADELRRIAAKQVDKALAELDDEKLDVHEQVHQVRKRCKKLRGLVRLVRPAMGDAYDEANTYFRDTARQLSDVRDATVLIETAQSLTDHYPSFEAAVRVLRRRRTRVLEKADLAERLKQVRTALEDAKPRIAKWKLDDSGFDAIRGGLKKTFKRCRKTMDAAYDEPSAANFHQWRKRTKYHRYHLRLLRELWKPVMKKWRNQAKQLSDLQGDEHDLAVLGDAICEDIRAFGGTTKAKRLLRHIADCRAEMHDDARPLGERLYAEKPGAIRKRLGAYWHARQANPA